MTERDDPTDATIDRLLANEPVWAEPPGSLEDDVVALVRQHRDEPPSRRSREQWRTTAIAAGLTALAATVVALVAVLGGPAGRTYDSVHELTATALAPGATARVEVTVTGVGTRLVLDVEDLAAASTREVYEGWMLDGDRAVSAGTFHLRAGDAAIELWSGVPPTTFDEFVVTRHAVGAPVPADGPATGAVVLEGSLRR